MFTTYLKSALLEHVFRSITYADPAAVYVGLLTAVAGHDAGSVTECSVGGGYTGYARQAVTFGAAAAQGGGMQVANSATVTFPTNGGSTQNVIAFGIFDNSSGGNLLDIIYIDADAPVLFTAVVSGNLFTAPGHGYSNDQKCRVSRFNGITLPTGPSENVEYFFANITTDTFQLSTTAGGGNIVTISVPGSGIVAPYTLVPIPGGSTPEYGVGAIAVQLD